MPLVSATVTAPAANSAAATISTRVSHQRVLRREPRAGRDPAAGPGAMAGRDPAAGPGAMAGRDPAAGLVGGRRPVGRCSRR